jgi:hypothetical protein
MTRVMSIDDDKSIDDDDYESDNIESNYNFIFHCHYMLIQSASMQENICSTKQDLVGRKACWPIRRCVMQN